MAEGVVWVWHSKSKVLSGGGSECGLNRQKCGMARKHGRGRSVGLEGGCCGCSGCSGRCGRRRWHLRAGVGHRGCGGCFWSGREDGGVRARVRARVDREPGNLAWDRGFPVFFSFLPSGRRAVLGSGTRCWGRRRGDWWHTLSSLLALVDCCCLGGCQKQKHSRL